MNFGFLASPWIANFALFFLALSLSYLLTPMFAHVAKRLGIVAVPQGGRHIHTQATPLAGGVPVFVAYHAGMGVLLWSGLLPVDHKICTSYPGFLLASLILLGVGLVDDARNIKPLVKLAGQIVAASCIFFVADIRFAGLSSLITFPLWADYLVTVFWIVLAVNAFNLIDGMDGVAAGLATIIALGTAGVQFFLHDQINAIPYLIFAGACIGFLRFNFNPASVFLGDTGSMFLGLSLATLPLVTGTRKEFLSAVTIPLLMMGIPFFDTMVAIWRRGARSLIAQFLKQPTHGVMSGDKDHVHHRVLAYFANQRKAALFLYGINILLVVAALSMLMLDTRGIGLFLIVFMLICALVIRHLSAVELWDTGRLVLLRTTSRQWYKLRIPIYIAADFTAMGAAWFISRALVSLPITGETFRNGFLLFALPLFILLLLFRVYNRIWTRARPHEFAVIPCAVLISGGVILAALHLFDITYDGCIREVFIFCVVVCWPLLGMRMLSSFLRDYVGLLSERRQNDLPTRTIVFGCGGRFALFMYEHNRNRDNLQRRIVGLLDDDLLLRDRHIAGFKVLGPLEFLPLIAGKTGANEILVTPALSAERLRDVCRIAAQVNCRVTLFEVGERRA